jgi:hypothetical protein
VVSLQYINWDLIPLLLLDIVTVEGGIEKKNTLWALSSELAAFPPEGYKDVSSVFADQ